MVFVVAAAALLSGIAFRYGQDLSESVVALFREGGSDAMARAGQRHAFARVVVLAALADDELSEAEWAALGDLYAEHPEFDDDPEVIVSGLRFLGVEVRDRDALERQVALTADELDEPLRRAAFAVVAELAAHGSGVSGGAASYRVSARNDPAGLVEVFARALGIADVERDAVLAEL